MKGTVDLQELNKVIAPSAKINNDLARRIDHLEVHYEEVLSQRNELIEQIAAQSKPFERFNLEE